MNTGSTIVAPATGSGEGGIGILRISGDRAESSLKRFFRPSRKVEAFESHRLYHGYMLDREEKRLDEVMAVLMRAPHSYTREDVVEIHCHGGALVMQSLLDLYLEEGLVLASPGEFTLRAFLNGRIDLAEAEGVIDLIRARSEGARVLALQQMEGKLSRLIYAFRERLLDVLVEIEAHIDFPDEDLDLSSNQRLAGEISSLLGDVRALLDSFDNGRVLREGVSVLILGRPNVGKSSLLNALLGEARAIVTDTPGTTRDVLEENLRLDGLPIKLIDTAGVRDSDDPIEREGVKRARAKVEQADLVLFVLDGGRCVEDDDLQAVQACAQKRTLVVVNKCDLGRPQLPTPLADFSHCHVSVHSGEGLDRLKEFIVETFTGETGGDSRETVMIADRRHREALLRAQTALGEAVGGLGGGASLELVAIDLREALAGLEIITGQSAPEEVLERIFSQFCIGK